MRVLVTGGSGDIGGFVVPELQRGHDVVVADLNPPAAGQDVEYRQVDLLDASAAARAVRDVDVVVHLAAIPHPFNDPGDRVLHVNTVSAYNVLEAIRANGIPRAIYGGSESETGLGIHNVEYRPLYLPIDVDHPCWPHESYSLSKYFGELMFREYARAYGIKVIATRFVWVWLERDRESIEALLAGSGDQSKNWLGGYVMPQDVARMVALAVDYEQPAGPLPFEAFFAHAAQTFLSIPTLEQARRMWGDLPEIRRPDYYDQDPMAPFFDLTDARQKLRYRPGYTCKDYLAAGSQSDRT